MKNNGFTLLEILIALFIFTIISFMLVFALHQVINAQADTESKAERLRLLQMALLIFSRDIEQAVNRPIVNADGKDEETFIGNTQGLQFTHAGYANSPGTLAHSSLQRSGYSWKENSLIRTTWEVLDQTPETKSKQKVLLRNVTEMHFQYLDHAGRMQDRWPLDSNTSQSLPRGVRIYLNIAHWGKMTQLYLIPAYKNDNSLLVNQAKENHAG